MSDESCTVCHNNYGNLGSEFIIEHKRLKTKHLWVAFILSGLFAVYVDLHTRELGQLWVILFFLALILIFRLFRKVHREVILILPAIGLQLSTEYFLGQRQTRFIDIVRIKDVVINEAISMQSIVSYLAVLLKDENTGELMHLHPLFTQRNSDPW